MCSPWPDAVFTGLNWWPRVIDGTVADLLSRWLPSQRWFAGQHAESVRIESQRVLDTVVPIHHLIITTGPDRYQLFLAQLADLEGTESLPRHAVIGVCATGRMVVDALYLPACTTALLKLVATSSDGELRGLALADPLPGLGQAGVPISGEQSNTSLVYGQQSILKVLRRIQPGLNPDFEVSQALTVAGCQQVPQLYGALSGSVGDIQGTTLAVLTEYLPDAQDGFQAAVTVTQRIYAGDMTTEFADQAQFLGVAVAKVHTELATSFGPDDTDRHICEQMAAEARAIAAKNPAVADLLPAIERTFRQAAAAGGGPSQRIHGDLHLGQCLLTASGWKIIDFEGEPSASLEQRRQHQPVLRDIAGMLRSFDYAAGFPRVAAGGFDNAPSARAARWTALMRTRFCAGYASVTGFDPQTNDPALRAFELAKAIYEVDYEASYRPDWVGIPLHAAQMLLRQGETP